MGFGPFFFCALVMDLEQVVTAAVEALGFELVDLQLSNRGKLLRVFIDKPDGITVDDCARVSNQLTRVFAVEHIDYDRLEVSSPGLDRPLKRAADFNRFKGEKVQLKLKIPVNNQRNFVGVLRGMHDDMLTLDIDGAIVEFGMANLEKARLVPNI